MVTQAKRDASRRNGRLSGGPKSADGKAVARLNAIAHGLRALSPVIPGERAKDWNDHRAGIISALMPTGTLETELAERVALLTWRLRRVAVYETALVESGIDTATAHARGERDDDDHQLTSLSATVRHTGRTWATVSKELDAARQNAASFERFRDQIRALPDLPEDHPFRGGEAFTFLREVTGYTPSGNDEYFDIEDRQFLAAVGVPEEWRDEPDWWGGWTARLVRNGVEQIAKEDRMTADELTARAVREADRTVTVYRRQVTRLEEELAELAATTQAAERVARSRASLPGADAIDKMMRYEAHLTRQLTQTLHLLERIQATRRGSPSAPPAALDVTVQAEGMTFTPSE